MDIPSNVPNTDLTASDVSMSQSDEPNRVVQNNDNDSNCNVQQSSVVRLNNAATESVVHPDHILDPGSCVKASTSVPCPSVPPHDSDQLKYEPVEVTKQTTVPELQQILKIEPAKDLFFIGPFNIECSTTLKLANPTNACVLFKIKTTAPDRYFVELNYGAISAKNKLSIKITRKQHSERDVADEAISHMFMVQSCYAPQNFDDAASTSELMRRMPVDQISQTVLKCVFIQNADATPIGADNTENIALPMSSLPYSSARDGFDGLIDATSVQENDRN